MGRSVVPIVRDQSLGRPARRKSIHWKIRNDLLGLECRPLHCGVDRRFEPLRNIDGDIADSRLKVHVQIAIDVFGNEMNDDIAGSCRSLHPCCRTVETNIAGLRVTLEWAAYAPARDRASRRLGIDSRGITD